VAVATLIDTLARLVVHYAPSAGTITLAKVAQSVEHSTENAGVGGSIPPLGTRISPLISLFTLSLGSSSSLSHSHVVDSAILTALDCIWKGTSRSAGDFLTVEGQ
jgi:hypothetical protein